MQHEPISVEKLINDMGGPTEAAAALGIKNPSVVMNWRTRKQVPAKRAIDVERLTGISRHVLRPDIFGPAPVEANAQ